MYKYFLVFAATFTSLYNTYGQQDPLYATYINNPLVINPAYTGINNAFNAAVSYRRQWTGFEGSPNTSSFSAHSSFLDNKIGAGIFVVSDVIGATNNTHINLTYSYKIVFEQNVLSFGLQTGVVNINETSSDLTIRDPQDPLFRGDANVSKFNVGFGAAYKTESYYIGFSIPHLTNNVSDFGNLEAELYQRHFYLMGGYIAFLSKNLAIKPTVLLKGVSGAPASIDINANVVYAGNYTAGLLTRNFETIGVLLQMYISRNLQVGYVFETDLFEASVGRQFTTHEVSLMLDLELIQSHRLRKRFF